MEKFEFRMNKPGVYLDKTNLRLVKNLRSNFSRLADQLITEEIPNQLSQYLIHVLS